MHCVDLQWTCCFVSDNMGLLDDCLQEGEQLLAGAALAPVHRDCSGATALIDEYGTGQDCQQRLQADIASSPCIDRAAFQRSSAGTGSEGAINAQQV